jgi:hypothetical protein
VRAADALYGCGLLMENTVWYNFFVLWWGVFLAVIVAGIGSPEESYRLWCVVVCDLEPS